MRLFTLRNHVHITNTPVNLIYIYVLYKNKLHLTLHYILIKTSSPKKSKWKTFLLNWAYILLKKSYQHND